MRRPRIGFAEADPTADVEGLDVQAKIALLANLAFGQVVPTNTIPTVGISRVSTADFRAAQSLKCTIKLIGCAERSADGSSVAVYVSPMLVPLTSSLASVKGAGNMVELSSSNNVQSILAGPGAGRYPTGKYNPSWTYSLRQKYMWKSNIESPAPAASPLWAPSQQCCG